MDAGAITAWRTGASVGVAARYLARPHVTCVGVLGCGVQARAAVRALAAVLPELRAVRCHDAIEAAVDAFSVELGAELPAVEFSACPAPAGVTRGAGVVVTAITMTADIRPPLGPGLLEPGALAVALDYDAAWSAAAMAACDRFFCDDVATVRATQAAGVRLAGIPAEIDGDLGAPGRRPRRRSRRPGRAPVLPQPRDGARRRRDRRARAAPRPRARHRPGAAALERAPLRPPAPHAVRRRDRRARTGAARAGRRSASPRRGGPRRRGPRAAAAARGRPRSPRGRRPSGRSPPPRAGRCR